MVFIKVRSVPDLLLMTILKGVLTIRCFNDASVWNLRQIKTQKIEAENKEARSLILQHLIHHIYMYDREDILGSLLSSFTMMDLIHMQLFLVMKTKTILILKLLFS